MIIDIRYANKSDEGSYDLCEEYRYEVHLSDKSEATPQIIASSVKDIYEKYKTDQKDHRITEEYDSLSVSVDGKAVYERFNNIEMDLRAFVDGLVRRNKGLVDCVKLYANGVVWELEEVGVSEECPTNLTAESLVITKGETQREYFNIEMFSPYRDSKDALEYEKNLLCAPIGTPFFYLLQADWYNKIDEEYEEKTKIYDLKKKQWKRKDDIVWLLEGKVVVDYSDAASVELCVKKGVFYYCNNIDESISKSPDMFRDNIVPLYAEEKELYGLDYEIVGGGSVGSDLEEVVRNGVLNKHLIYETWESAEESVQEKILKHIRCVETICSKLGMDGENYRRRIQIRNNGDDEKEKSIRLKIQSDRETWKCEVLLELQYGIYEPKQVMILFKNKGYLFEVEHYDGYNEESKISAEDNRKADNILKFVDSKKKVYDTPEHYELVTEFTDINQFSEHDREIISKCNSLEGLAGCLKELSGIREQGMQQYVHEWLEKTGYEYNRKNLEQSFRNKMGQGDKAYIVSEQLMEEFTPAFADWFPVMALSEQTGKPMDELVSVCMQSSSYILPIPWITLMGEAGTGKTTAARKLAENCLGASFIETSGGDLKGAYVGHTSVRVASMIHKLQRQGPEGKPAVLFIDEAYTLFEGKDGFSSEVIELILAIASSQKGYVIDVSKESESGLKGCRLVDDNDNALKEVVVHPNTVIWLGGYEDRLRNSFRVNEGLSRRFPYQITIPTPGLDELYELFRVSFKDVALSAQDEKKIKEFLGWGTSRSRSRLFGNRSGVGILINYCKKYINIGYEMSEALEKSISRVTENINRQYSAELKAELKRMPFEVINDVKENLDEHYAGYSSLKKEINEVIDLMIDPGLSKERNIRLPKGALLMGSPGTGKSYLAKCMAGQLNKRLKEKYAGLTAENKSEPKDVAFIPLAAAEILAMENPINAVKILFSEAAKYDSAIIFLDEVDAIGGNRNQDRAVRGVLTQLMIEMDGFGDGGNIFVLAATNDPGSLDAAFKREGRFDMSFEINMPDVRTSLALIELEIKKYGFRMDPDFMKKKGVEPKVTKGKKFTKAQTERIWNLLGGRVPAVVHAMLNQAVLLYHRTERGLYLKDWEHNPVPYEHRHDSKKGYLADKKYHPEETTEICNVDGFLADLKETLDIKSMGRRSENPEAKGTKLNLKSNDFDDSCVAIHEVGHALMTRLLYGAFGLERITILGRGDAAGYVEHERNSHRLLTRKDYYNQIKILMGGRIAEEVIYHDVSSGASNDIMKATDIAKTMVEQLGFSDDIGFVCLGVNKGAYLGGEYENICSDEMRYEADKVIGKILKECYEDAMKQLSENKDIIIKLATEILKEKEITGKRLEEIYQSVVE